MTNSYDVDHGLSQCPPGPLEPIEVAAPDTRIRVEVEPDPRGVSVGVWQGSHCIYSGAHPIPAPASPVSTAADEGSVKRLRDAIEGECSGVWISEKQAIAVLAHLNLPAPAAGDALDWYERRRELEPNMIFRTAHGVVKLDRGVPGDGTKWYVLDWNGDGWSAYDDTIEPGDLIGAPVADHPIAIELARTAAIAQQKGEA